jgi:adenosylhomocysteinase
VDAAELEWIAWTNPITTAFGREIASSDLSGRTVACHQHITPNNICIVGPLLQAGARVRMAPCNPDSTDDRAASHLASMGVEIRGRAGMSAVERAEALVWLASEPADALCDMGGELIAAMATAGYLPAGALEATTTGLHRLAGLEIPFPVLDWNGIALKDLIHNRHHVGAETRPASPALTGLSLYGREIVVVGFGPVGLGVAERGRDLGANVTVVDRDPVRLVLAQHHGCRVADFDDAVRRASVVVTATAISRRRPTNQGQSQSPYGQLIGLIS